MSALVMLQDRHPQIRPRVAQFSPDFHTGSNDGTAWLEGLCVNISVVAAPKILVNPDSLRFVSKMSS